jgi:hypothetical protein
MDEGTLSSFGAGADPESAARPSVFSGIDQEAIIARLDDVQDDDLDSSFFAEAMVDVENASTRAFDIGVRAGEPVPPAPAPVGTTPFTTAGLDATPAAREDDVLGATHEARDERTAFILGGPGALGA